MASTLTCSAMAMAAKRSTSTGATCCAAAAKSSGFTADVTPDQGALVGGGAGPRHHIGRLQRLADRARAVLAVVLRGRRDLVRVRRRHDAQPRRRRRSGVQRQRRRRHYFHRERGRDLRTGAAEFQAGPGDVFVGNSGDTFDFNLGRRPRRHDRSGQFRAEHAQFRRFDHARPWMQVELLGTSMVFTFQGSNDRITWIDNGGYTPNGNVFNAIGTVNFADGTTWSTADLLANATVAPALSVAQNGSDYEVDYNIGQGYASVALPYEQQGTNDDAAYFRSRSERRRHPAGGVAPRRGSRSRRGYFDLGGGLDLGRPPGRGTAVRGRSGIRPDRFRRRHGMDRGAGRADARQSSLGLYDRQYLRSTASPAAIRSTPAPTMTCWRAATTTIHMSITAATAPPRSWSTSPADSGTVDTLDFADIASTAVTLSRWPGNGISNLVIPWLAKLAKSPSRTSSAATRPTPRSPTAVL